MDNYTQEKMLDSLNRTVFALTNIGEVKSEEDLGFIQTVEIAASHICQQAQKLIKEYQQKK